MAVDRSQHLVELKIDLIIGEADNLKAHRFEYLLAFLIFEDLRLMNRTIGFYDQVILITEEIHHEPVNWVLTAKLIAMELPIAQKEP